MKILLQLVSRAEVRVQGEVVGKIGRGLLLYVGIHHSDTVEEAFALAQKAAQLRIFRDERDKMHLSLQDVQGSVLVISQFTLYANTSEGRRPSFIEAAPPEMARGLYGQFVGKLTELLGEARVEQGVFGAHMEVDYINDGPVTIIL